MCDGGRLRSDASAVTDSAATGNALVQALAKPPIALHEATDDLISDVDRILDKVSQKGADSLTAKEKAILNRYTQLRH